MFCFVYRCPRAFQLSLTNLFIFLQIAIICQRLHDVTVNRSLDLLETRTRVGELEESFVTVEVHSELQKKFEDSQTRVQELEIDLVTEESKVSSVEDSLKRLREESEEKLWLAQESEDKLLSDLGKLRSELARWQAKAEAESKARAMAEARVKSADEELEGIAVDDVYLAWTHNRSMELSFLKDPSAQARFETRLSAEESAAAQARHAASEGRVPEANPVVEIEAEVPPSASDVPAPP